MTNAMWDPWSYRETVTWEDRRAGMDDVTAPGGMSDRDVTEGSEAASAASRRDLTGFKVEATDGSIGKVDQDTNEVGSSYIVVDTGPWIFGRKVLLPAGTIDQIDWADERVYVDRTQQQVKDSPELTDDDFSDTSSRDRVGDYYRNTYI